MLVAGLFSGLARINTAASRSFTHGITFGVDLAVFTNIVQYAYSKTKKSRKGMPFCRKWGPFNCLLAATVLSMADLTRHLANDAWGTQCTDTEEDQVLGLCDTTGKCSALPSKFTKYCYSQNVANEFSGGEGFPHLSVYGWVFTIFCTWSGFILLFIGMFWLISLPAKLRAQWRALRRGPAAAASLAGPPGPAAPPAPAGGRPLLGG